MTKPLPQKRTSWLQKSAGAAIGVFALAALSSPSASADDPKWDNCGQNTNFKSSGGYTKADGKICISQTVSKNGKDKRDFEYMVSITGIAYKWGGTWYDNKYPASATGEVQVSRDGKPLFNESVSGKTDSKSWLSMFSSHKLQNQIPGSYTVKAKVTLKGSYWDGDKKEIPYTDQVDLSFVVAK